MAQIVSIVSEALEATVRRLLPSQRGFGEDLQASNVIMPIIDLTPTAEGSSLPLDLQTAFSYVDQTTFNVANTTSTVASTAGFLRITGTYGLIGNTVGGQNIQIQVTDGTTPKELYRFGKPSGTSVTEFITGQYDFVIFLRSGDSVTVTASSAAFAVGSSRQIADLNGNLVDPTGFTPQ